MRRKNAYLVILRTHVDETLAIARIMRSRMRRKIAGADLATKRRRALIQGAALRWQTRVKRIVGGKGSAIVANAASRVRAAARRRMRNPRL